SVKEELDLRRKPPAARAAAPWRSLKRWMERADDPRLRRTVLSAGRRLLDQLAGNELVEALRLGNRPEIVQGGTPTSRLTHARIVARARRSRVGSPRQRRWR